MKYLNVYELFQWYFSDVKNLDGVWGWEIMKEYLTEIKHHPWNAQTKSPVCTRFIKAKCKSRILFSDSKSV